MFEVVFYEKNSGKKPVENFLNSLEPKMRAKLGSNISRIMYFFYYDKKIIMTNGFIKKTQKTPRNEIELAKKCRNDFLESMR